MLYSMVPAAFQHVQEADYIAVDVGVWVVQGITYASLRGEVDDPVEVALGKQSFH